MKTLLVLFSMALTTLFIPGSELHAQIIKRDKKWDNGQVVKILFINGGAEEKRLFTRAVEIWSRYTNLDFRFFQIEKVRLFLPLKFKHDTIRVTFNSSEERNYSEVGTNFNVGLGRANFLNIAIDPNLKLDFLSTALHEFGHALGLKHEHQHPDAFKNFTRDDLKMTCKYLYMIDVEDEYEMGRCIFNIGSLTPEQIEQDDYVIAEYDNKSIMHYEGIGEPNLNFHNIGLSLHDKIFMAEQYPFDNELTHDELVEMDKGDQKEEMEWIFNEYRHDTCKFSYRGEQLFLTMHKSTKKREVRIKNLSSLDTYFKACTRN